MASIASPSVPMMFRSALNAAMIPHFVLGSAASPAALVPMKLPWIRLSSAASLVRLIPDYVLPEITLRAPAVEPPMRLPAVVIRIEVAIPRSGPNRSRIS